MNKRRFRLFSTVLVVVMVVVLCIGAACAAPTVAPPTAEKKGSIKMAMITDLTGIAASQVHDAGFVAEDYSKWVNETQGGINGHPVEMKVYDCKYDLAICRDIYKRIRFDVHALSFDSMSHALEALAPFCAIDEVPDLMMTGLASVLYPPSWTFGTLVSYADKPAAYGDWIMKNWKENRKPRYAMINLDIASCRTGEFAIPYLKDLGIDVVAVERVPWGATDVTDQYVRVKNANPDFIYDSLPPDMLKVALPTRQRLGITAPEINFILNDWHTSKLVTPDQLAGYMFWYEGAGWWEKDIPGVKFSYELSQKYRNTDPSPVYIAHIGTMMMWFEAIKRAMDTVGYEKLNGKALYDALMTIRGFTGQGIWPKGLSYYPDDVRGYKWNRIVRVEKDGSRTWVSDEVEMPWVMKIEAGKKK